MLLNQLLRSGHSLTKPFLETISITTRRKVHFLLNNGSCYKHIDTTKVQRIGVQAQKCPTNSSSIANTKPYIKGKMIVGIYKATY